jgi:hypothetical protein
MEKCITTSSEKWLDGNGILHIRYIEGAIVDLPAMMESRADNKKLLKGKMELVLCDIRVSFTITPDAQKYARKEIINQSRAATAVISNKGYVKLVVNFALNFFMLRSPVRMFSKEQDALKWLHSFKQN